MQIQKKSDDKIHRFSFGKQITIPINWDIANLKDVCTKITDGTHKTPKYVETGIPFISTTNIQPFSKGFDFSSYRKFVSLVEHTELTKRCKPEKNDLLVSKCGTIGRTKLIDVDYEFSIFVGLMLLKINKKKVLPKFLEQLLNLEYFVREMEMLSPGSSRATLTIGNIEKIKIPIPSILEQQKIASILSNVDSLINQTQKEIEQTQRLKKGLMQKLLTKGIGHKKFKKVKWLFGREIEIPEEWELLHLQELVESYKNGIYKPEEFYGKGIPNIRMFNIQNGKINKNNVILLDVTNKEAEDYSLMPSDILINRVNSDYLVGKSGIVPDNFGHATFESKNIRVRVKQKICNPKFVNYYFNSQQYFIQILSLIKTAVAQVTINQDDLNMLLVPVFPLNEQEKIVSIIDSVDSKIQDLTSKKSKLKSLKKGLMQKLLTGQIRVKV